jgi:dolichol-phosphate mannosyltransferase
MFLGGLMLGASTILTILVIRAGLFLNPQSGWVSLMLATLMFSGLILFFLGAIGFYVGKSFEEIRGRPTYLVETETGRAR